MAPKRPTPTKPAPGADDWKITDEWGIYDPEKAGIPALFRRLGRPVLRAAPSTSRRERRRALRPERTDEGVGLALAEAKRRAGYDMGDEMPSLGGNPARAMRLALKARAAANAAGTTDGAPFVPPPVETKAPVQQARTHTPALETPAAPAAPAPKRRSRKSTPTAAETAPSAAAVQPVEVEAPKTRARRTTRRAKVEAAPATATPVETLEPAPVPVATAPAVAIPPPVVAPPEKTGPPAPSPRRPRGPVPLAAWARAVDVEPKPEPVRADKRGFWRSLFQIPAEVALVEYAHGCRIHRLLVEAGDDHLPDFI